MDFTKLKKIIDAVFTSLVIGLIMAMCHFTVYIVFEQMFHKMHNHLFPSTVGVGIMVFILMLLHFRLDKLDKFNKEDLDRSVTEGLEVVIVFLVMGEILYFGILKGLAGYLN